MPPRKEKPISSDEIKAQEAYDNIRDPTLVDGLAKALGLLLTKQIDDSIQQNFKDLNDALLKIATENIKLQAQVKNLQEENKALISKVSQSESRLQRFEKQLSKRASACSLVEPSGAGETNSLEENGPQLEQQIAADDSLALHPPLFSSLAVSLPPGLRYSKPYFPPKKIIGVGEKSSECKIKTAKIIERKFILHIDNISEEVSSKDIVEYAKAKSVEVLSIFPKKSWIQK